MNRTHSRSTMHLICIPDFNRQIAFVNILVSKLKKIKKKREIEDSINEKEPRIIIIVAVPAVIPPHSCCRR